MERSEADPLQTAVSWGTKDSSHTRPAAGPGQQALCQDSCCVRTTARTEGLRCQFWPSPSRRCLSHTPPRKGWAPSDTNSHLKWLFTDLDLFVELVEKESRFYKSQNWRANRCKCALSAGTSALDYREAVGLQRASEHLLLDQFHCTLGTHWVRGRNHTVQRSCALLRGVGNQTWALIAVCIHRQRQGSLFPTYGGETEAQSDYCKSVTQLGRNPSQPDTYNQVL